MSQEKNCYIYRHVRLDKNQVFYIGVGTRCDNCKQHHNRYARAHDKHGRSDFWKKVVAKTEYRVEIVIEGLAREEALKKENALILFYGRRVDKKGNLVNFICPGDSGYTIGIEYYRSDKKEALEEALLVKRSITDVKTGLIWKDIIDASEFMLRTNSYFAKNTGFSKERIQQEIAYHLWDRGKKSEYSLYYYDFPTDKSVNSMSKYDSIIKATVKSKRIYN